ncbi:MAG TPA: hypothetical protein DIC56_11890 [Rhizobium sp.]|nr:hypothetical protein [Rhizobium sp.]
MLRRLFPLCMAFVSSVMPVVGSTAMSNDFEKNEEVRQILRKQGDDSRTARVVQHYAYFQTSEARDLYRDFLFARGYKVDRESHQDPYFNPWGIVFSKVQVPNDIDVETEELDINAAKFGGEYDGWESGIVRSP